MCKYKSKNEAELITVNSKEEPMQYWMVAEKTNKKRVDKATSFTNNKLAECKVKMMDQ